MVGMTKDLPSLVRALNIAFPGLILFHANPDRQLSDHA